jgi:hypothetical protein
MAWGLPAKNLRGKLVFEEVPLCGVVCLEEVRAGEETGV